jgi:hypothetical protein
MSANEVEIADHSQTGVGPQRSDAPGTWYWKTCVDPNGNASATVVWAPQRVSPVAVARQALGYTALADPAIGMSPPPTRGAVVNVPLWLWVDTREWAPTSATASIDGVTVKTTATPDRVRWTLGNGDEIVCAGPGLVSTTPGEETPRTLTYDADRSISGGSAHDLVPRPRSVILPARSRTSRG